MPRTKAAARLETRLTAKDLERLDQICQSKSMNRGEVARLAILWYLDNHQMLNPDERLADTTAQLNKIADRICALLYKLGVDTHAMARFIWEMGDDKERDAFEVCHEKAIKYMRNKLTAEEKENAASLIN